METFFETPWIQTQAPHPGASGRARARPSWSGFAPCCCLRPWGKWEKSMGNPSMEPPRFLFHNFGVFFLGCDFGDLGQSWGLHTRLEFKERRIWTFQQKSCGNWSNKIGMTYLKPSTMGMYHNLRLMNRLILGNVWRLWMAMLPLI